MTILKGITSQADMKIRKFPDHMTSLRPMLKNIIMEIDHKESGLIKLHCYIRNWENLENKIPSGLHL